MKEKVEKLIHELTAGTHLFLAELLVKGNRIEIALDGDAGVNIAECAVLNRRLHRRLEEDGVDIDNYIVEVSSPGVDRPLLTVRDFKKNVGRKLQVRNAQGKQVKGQLVMAHQGGIWLHISGPKVKIEKMEYSQVKEAKVTF